MKPALPWQDPVLRWGVSLAMGSALVSLLALAAKFLVESLTPYSYTIHWLETVPVLVALFAWIVQRRLRRRSRVHGHAPRK